MTEKTKLDNIIGIVKTEEKTDSVELKKEYYKNQSKDKRFKLSMLPLQNIRDDKEPLSQQEVVDRLNEQEERIKELERHIERNTISRITVEDVLSCARDNRFYDNEEIVKAIDCIAKDLKVNIE